VVADLQVGGIVSESTESHAKGPFESTEMFRVLAEWSPNIVFVNVAGRVVYVNPLGAEALGYSREEMCAADFDFRSLVAPDSLRAIEENYARHMKGEVLPPYECGLVTRAGDRMDVIIASRLVEIGGERGILGIVTDISERKRLEERLQRTQLAIDRAGDTVFWTEADASFVYANDAACDSLGYSRDELLSMKVFEIDPDFSPEAWPQRWEELRELRARTMETRHRTKDGRIFPVELTVNYFEFEGREYSLAFCRDITERKRAEASIRESQELYRTLVMTSPDGVTVTDLEGRITQVSQRAVEMAGCDGPEDLIGNSSLDFLSPDDAADAMDGLRKTFSEGIARGLEYTFVRKDGTSYVGELDAALLRDAHGRPKGFIGTVRDTTDRKRAEEALRESQTMLQLVLDTIPVSVFWKDRNSVYVGCNRQWSEAVGVARPADAVGKTDHDIFPDKDLADSYRDWDRRVMEGGKPVLNLVEEFRAASDAEYSWARTSKVPMHDNEGKVVGILGTYEDITENKRAEEERTKLQEQLRQALEQERNRLALEVASLRSQMEERHGLDSMVGQDPRMRAIFETILAVSNTRATVLIQGETGTGKELAARAIHYNSPQHDKAFVKVDCGALAENLLESELFGHVRGAFTGAVRDRQGRFEVADEGTIFLDEIQNLSMPLQSKLLRVVQEGRFEKVGGTETRSVDVRVIATTNEDPETLVAEGRLRKDLYYRLNVVPIKLPPLRERRGDIPLLVLSFIERFADRHDKKVSGITKEAVDRLAAYGWPGNVRELENIIEQAVVFARGDTIQDRDIRLPDQVVPPSRSRSLGRASREAETRAILEALERTGGNKKRAADLLGISRSALYEKLKRHGIAKSRD
jgi:PAS domain S-box-containing protein